MYKVTIQQLFVAFYAYQIFLKNIIIESRNFLQTLFLVSVKMLLSPAVYA